MNDKMHDADKDVKTTKKSLYKNRKHLEANLINVEGPKVTKRKLRRQYRTIKRNTEKIWNNKKQQRKKKAKENQPKESLLNPEN
jgi:hypothetical protein